MKVKRKSGGKVGSSPIKPEVRRTARGTDGRITKKGKRKARRDTFLERLKAAQSTIALAGTKEEVLASVKQIGDSLPSLTKTAKKAAAPKRTKPLTNKTRGKLFKAEVSQFASVLQHSSFVADPLAVRHFRGGAAANVSLYAWMTLRFRYHAVCLLCAKLLWLAGDPAAPRKHNRHAFAR
jgi:hypothetical protein